MSTSPNVAPSASSTAAWSPHPRSSAQHHHHHGSTSSHNNHHNTNSANYLGTPRTLRKLKSAHVLSSHPPNGNPPSLISLQRQQQQQQQQQQRSYKDPSLSVHAPPPVLPPTPSSSHGRSRSNSDAAVFGASTYGPATRKPPVTKKLVAAAAAAASAAPVGGSKGTAKNGVTLEALLRDGPRNGDVVEGLRSMRQSVLSEGVASDTDGMSSLRIYVWLILLGGAPLATDDYLNLVHRGPSPAYAKIRNDTFRTLATDPLFRRRVSEASLIRLLNAVAWTLHDTQEERLKACRSPVLNVATTGGSPELRQATVVSNADGAHVVGQASSGTRERAHTIGADAGTYVQGMNVLAAPFLYAARSEAEAFVAFHRFLSVECPGYVRGAMDGVHRGVALVDRVLKIVDPKLSAYLLSKSMTAELYAFPSVLTLCACTPPLPEVLHLWDFLFAYGAHLNILCIVAQLVMMRENILESPSPVKILRSFPPLQASRIKWMTVELVQQIPDGLYDEMVKHAK